MAVWVLVVWFGLGNGQVAFSVPGISSEAECRRLGDVMRPRYPVSTARCYQYRAARTQGDA